MTDLTDGTVCHDHRFDGCTYGLKSQYQETRKPIQFRSLGRSFRGGCLFQKLRRKCDHAECAGRETRMTQIYTKWIAKIIMRGINDRVQRNRPYVNVKVMKRWYSIKLDDDMKRAMSRDSENVRR